MTKLMIDSFGGDHRKHVRPAHQPASPDNSIECYHVDARLSNAIEDIGRARKGKILFLLKYCFEAVWCRLRYGVRNFYYVPAPGQRVPLYRDWIVMAICRPFFRKIIFHSQGVGLGTWLAEKAHAWERFISRPLLGKVDLSIILSESYRAEAAKLSPRRVEIVPNGIADPCPDFDSTVLPRRLSRVAARRQLIDQQASTEAHEEIAGKDGNIFRLLYLSMCHREKGLFDLLEAVALFHLKLRKLNSPIRVRLDVAGDFFHELERNEFEKRIAQPDLQDERTPVVKYHGFSEREAKSRLLRESDCFCLPTYYQAEGQPVSLVEALAFGLPVITTRWRAIPDLFPPDYPGLVAIKSPAEIAARFECFLRDYPAANFRETFLTRFTEERFVKNLKAAILTAATD